MRYSLFIAIVAFVMMAGCMSVTNVFASDISVTINGDTAIARGFCWYTDEKAGTDLQIAPVGEDLTKAEIVSGTSYPSMEKYVHKTEDQTNL